MHKFPRSDSVIAMSRSFATHERLQALVLIKCYKSSQTEHVIVYLRSMYIYIVACFVVEQ